MSHVLSEWEPGTFTAALVIRKLPAQRRWWLEAPLGYRSRAGRVFIVPAGFETDGASVPRVLWWLYPPFGGEYDRAAVVHDDLYARAEDFAGADRGHLSRGEADELMREMMEVDGFRKTGRWTIYTGVRLGGWVAWRRYRRAAAAAAAEED